MTREEFAQSESLRGWWKSVTDNPNFQFIIDEALERRRFNETFDSHIPHIDAKGMGYKEGVNHLISILKTIHLAPAVLESIPQEESVDHAALRFSHQ